MRFLNLAPSVRLNRPKTLLTALPLLLTATPVLAAESVPPGAEADGTMIFVYWTVALLGSLAALFFARKFFVWVVAQDEGDEKMVEIAEHVRQGARAYLNRQYKVVTIFFIVTGLLLAVVAFVFKAQSTWVPFAFLTGGFFSGLAGWFGMKTATLASSRTAACVWS